MEITIEKILLDKPCDACGKPKYIVYEWAFGDVHDCYYECAC